MDYKIIFVTLLVYSLFLNDLVPLNYQIYLKKIPIDIIICLLIYIIYKKTIFLIPILILIVKKYKGIIYNKDKIDINQKKIINTCGKFIKDNFKRSEPDKQKVFDNMNSCIKKEEKNYLNTTVELEDSKIEQFTSDEEDEWDEGDEEDERDDNLSDNESYEQDKVYKLFTDIDNIDNIDSFNSEYDDRSISDYNELEDDNVDNEYLEDHDLVGHLNEFNTYDDNTSDEESEFDF